MSHPSHSVPIDFNERPFITIWETTQACDLACVHCRAEAQSEPLPGELTHEEGISLIDQVAGMRTPVMVLSGGDPLKREDLYDLIRHGKKRRIRMGTIPAATPRLQRPVVKELKATGLDQMALSLDAPTADLHDTIRGVEGAYAKTREAAEWAHECKMPLQINSVISKRTFPVLDEMIDLVEHLGIVFWEVFFLVPVGRGDVLESLSAEEYEEAFAKLYALARRAPFIVKITEGPHFRRYYIEQVLAEAGIDPRTLPWNDRELPAPLRRALGPQGTIGRAPQGVNAGKGHCFISYKGEVFPSGFLPISAGNFKDSSLEAIYREHPLFVSLRDPNLLRGRCGRCEYRWICGGSRARAYAVTGHHLDEEPFCSYEPSAGQPNSGKTALPSRPSV